MPQGMKPFVLGIICAMLVGAVILFGIDHHEQYFTHTTQQGPSDPAKNTHPSIPSDAIKIQPLPPLQILSGSAKFEGKKEYPQQIAGSYARNIVIVHFRASGENSHNSAIKITWMDGTVDTIAPGAANVQLHSGKNAKHIVVTGYSVRERKIFKDSARPGTLEWEIRYESAKD